MDAKGKRAPKVLSILKRSYPGARITLRYRTQAELVVSVILSAQCTDRKVNEVTSVLFKEYKTFGDFAGCDRKTLERLIRPTGFYRNKAGSVIGCCKGVLERFGGRLPRTIGEMISLPGVGRKTANVVLSNAYGINEGVVVDTHVFRLARRLGLSAGKTPEKVEQDLIALFPKRAWLAVSNLLIHHGRAVCTAKRPACAKCSLSKICPSAFRI